MSWKWWSRLGVYRGALLLAGLDLLGDEESDETDGDDEDNAKHDHDTGVLAGPVAALGDVGHVASDDGEADGRHVDGCVVEWCVW